jgi:hypothetical protein
MEQPSRGGPEAPITAAEVVVAEVQSYVESSVEAWLGADFSLHVGSPRRTERDLGHE